MQPSPLGLDCGKIRLNLVNYHNIFYLANVTIGSNKQVFQLLLDINSPVSWVTSPDFNDSRLMRNHFDCSKSDTCVETNQVFNYTVLDFDISGEIIQDQLVFHHDVTLQNQTILLVDHIARAEMLIQKYPFLANVMHEFSIDGVLGLGYNTTDVEFVSILDNIEQQELVDKVAFALFLSYNHEGDIDEYSQLVIGEYDEKYLNAFNFSRFPVVEEREGWVVGVNSMFVGHEKVGAKNVALFATSSPFIKAPADVWEDLIDSLNQVDETCRFDPDGRYVFCDCEGTNEIEKFPNLVFFLSQENDRVRKMKVTPERYVQFHHGRCFLSLEKGDDFDGWVLGDAFLREYYSYYAIEEGFVALRPVRPPRM